MPVATPNAQGHGDISKPSGAELGILFLNSQGHVQRIPLRGKRDVTLQFTHNSRTLKTSKEFLLHVCKAIELTKKHTVF